MTTPFRILSPRRTPAAAALLAAAGLLAAGAAEAQPAQNLVIGLPVAAVSNLDPHGANSNVQGNLQINAQLFDTLVAFRDGKYEPSLATAWQANADATRWTFKLRPGVAFSDGSSFDAADVKASMERIVALAGPLAGLFKPLTLEIVAPDEIALTSKEGQGALLGKLSMLAIAPSEKLGADFGLKPVGSGPFVVERFDPSQGATLKANPNHWRGAPKLATVTFRMVPEQAARLTALETGEIQLTWTVPDDQVATLAANKALKVDSVATMANIVLWFNSSRPAFKDVAVRRALWSAIDTDAIVAALYPNTGQKMTGPLPPTVFGASTQTPYPFKPEESLAALKAKGWDFGRTVRILMNNTTYKPLVDAIIADWARVGVKAEVDLQEPAVGTKRLLDLDWDIAIIQPVITSTGDADYTLGRLYTCAAKRTTFCDPKLDELLLQAGAISDQAKRAELYRDAGKIIWDNAVGLFPMDVRQVWAWSARLDGVKLDPVYKPDLSQVRFAR